MYSDLFLDSPNETKYSNLFYENIRIPDRKNGFDILKDLSDKFLDGLKDLFTITKGDYLANDKDDPLADKNPLPLANSEILPTKRKRTRKTKGAAKATSTPEKEVKSQLKRRRGRPRKIKITDEDEESKPKTKRQSRSKRESKVNEMKLPETSLTDDGDDEEKTPKDDTPIDYLDAQRSDAEDEIDYNTFILEEATELDNSVGGDAFPPWVTGEGERTIDPKTLYNAMNQKEFDAELDATEDNEPEDLQEEPELPTLHKKYSEEGRLADPEKTVPDPDSILPDTSDIDEEVTEENRAEYEAYTEPVDSDPELEETALKREERIERYRMEGGWVLNPLDGVGGRIIYAQEPTLEEYNKVMKNKKIDDVEDDIVRYKQREMAIDQPGYPFYSDDDIEDDIIEFDEEDEE